MAEERNPRPGVEEWKNPRNGLFVLRIHYTADPRKRAPEWKAEASRNLHPRTWRREYEIDWTAPAGEPVVPEFQAERHKQAFEWDTKLRMLRFWDFGHVSPVCLFAQLTLAGQLRVRRELCPFNTPLDQLIRGVQTVTMELAGADALLARGDAMDVGGEPGREVGAFDAGDPASKSFTDLGSSAEVLGQHGIVLHTSRPGTEVSYADLRARFLQNVMDGGRPVPAIIVHPECPNLLNALAGAFCLDPTPPYKPTKSHPEKDLVDALRYGNDNIRAIVGKTPATWAAMAAIDAHEMRSAPEASRDDWAERQREKWRQIVEGM